MTERQTPTAEELRMVKRMVDEAIAAGKPAPVSATFDSGRTVTRQQAEIFAALEEKRDELRNSDPLFRDSTETYAEAKARIEATR